MQTIGGDVIAALLAAEGVKAVFGIVDGTYLGLLAALEKHDIRLVTPRHESSAAHMAGAYARLTGEVGVCLASNGPGVANILPGVAVENGEGNRVLVVTSCRRAPIVYPDRGGAYQYFDQVGVTRAMTKWSEAVPTVERLPELMRKALRQLFQGRPGVVHLDIPESIINGPCDLDPGEQRTPAQYRRVDPIPPPADRVAETVALLKKAERPLIHAGSGVIHAGAYAELQTVAEQVMAPVSTSWGGRPSFGESHPQSIPMIHIEVNNQARTQADLVLVLGSRLGETDWWGKPPYWKPPAEQTVIQVDCDEEMLGLNRPVTVPVLADVGEFLRQLSRALDPTDASSPVREARQKWVSGLREQVTQARHELDQVLENDAAPIHSAQVAHICQATLPPDTVFVVDGGNTAVWANYFHQVRAPNALLGTFKFGMLGAGVGQALGAQIARPSAPVCCIIGDGAMGFHPQEIETAVRNELAVIYVVVCDRQWGMVKLTQQVGLGGLREALGVDSDQTINADLNEIAFDDLARSMGAHGERVQSAPALRAAVERGRAQGKCTVIHVDVDPALHLWAPGLQHFKAMHQEPGA